MTFGPSDPWTQAMEQHPHMDTVRAEINDRLAGNNVAALKGQSFDNNFSLNGAPGEGTLSIIGKNVFFLGRDAFATAGVISREWSTGSYRLQYTFTNVQNGIAVVSFNQSDTLSFSSATRIPFTSTCLIADYTFGSRAAPGNNVNLAWYWTETFHYTPKK